MDECCDFGIVGFKLVFVEGGFFVKRGFVCKVVGEDIRIVGFII